MRALKINPKISFLEISTKIWVINNSIFTFNNRRKKKKLFQRKQRSKLGLSSPGMLICHFILTRTQKNENTYTLFFYRNRVSIFKKTFLRGSGSLFPQLKYLRLLREIWRRRMPIIFFPPPLSIHTYTNLLNVDVFDSSPQTIGLIHGFIHSLAPSTQLV